MTVLHAAAYVLAAVAGTGVVLTRRPLLQSMVLSAYSMILCVLFLTLHAPDVALSEIVVGTAVLPLIILLTLARMERTGGK